MSVNLNSSWLKVESGLELLDSSGVLVEDISDALLGGSVSRGGFRQIHATCRLKIARTLLWGSQRVRPYMTLTDTDGNTQTWYLGQFVLETPERTIGSSPEVYDVTGYDLMKVVRAEIGSGYTLDSGDVYLTEAETALTAVGNIDTNIDQTAIAETLAVDRSWALLDDPTYLRVATDLLAAVGYRAPYANRLGEITAEPYQSPGERAYTLTITSAIVEDMEVESDLFDVPNKWVGINSGIGEASLPTEGAGIYTLTNTSDGEASFDSRGYYSPRVIRLTDVASQDALEAAVEAAAESDRRIEASLTLSTGPLPSLWHQDAVLVNVPEYGAAVRCVSIEWDLDLTTGQMDHTMRRHSAVA